MLSAAAVAVVAVGVGTGVYVFGSARAAAAQQLPGTVTGTTGASTSPGLTTASDPSSAATPAPATPVPATPAAAATAPAVPPAETVTSPAPVPAECLDGDHQRDVESTLAQLDGYRAVTVDGVQTAEDCAVIERFQTRHGISPAGGRAGPLTASVARRIATSHTAQEQARCAAKTVALTVCIDLTQQTAWAVRDGAVVWGPAVVRTGTQHVEEGEKTPTGTYKIDRKNPHEWSKPFKVDLPYWQAFNGGIGFHQTTTYIHDASNGSHGCVNLLPEDAVALWRLTSVGTTVTVFGNRPGT
jgi:lipoprotein-anchoring transpeptidase ErfK/SrfK